MSRKRRAKKTVTRPSLDKPNIKSSAHPTVESKPPDKTNKALLILASLLLSVWLTCLLILALMSGS